MPAKPVLSYEYDGDEASPRAIPVAKKARHRESGIGGTGPWETADCPEAQDWTYPVGTWFRFLDGKGSVDAKLAWRSPAGSTLIFTDAKGRRVGVISSRQAMLQLQLGMMLAINPK